MLGLFFLLGVVAVVLYKSWRYSSHLEALRQDYLAEISYHASLLSYGILPGDTDMKHKHDAYIRAYHAHP